jgi:hypothetical protein
VRGFADTLSAAPRQLHLRRDGKEFVISHDGGVLLKTILN